MIISTMNNRMFQKPSTGVNTKDFKSRLGNFNNNASYQNFQKNESATKFLGAAIEFLSEPHNKVRYSLAVAHYLMGLKKYEDLPSELKKQVNDISTSFKTDGYFNGSILSDILSSGTKEDKAASSYFNGITDQNCEKTFEKLQLLYFNQELCLSIDEETVTRIVTQAYSSLSSPSPKISEEDIMTIKIYIQKQKLGQVGSGKVSQTDVLDVLLKFMPISNGYNSITYQMSIIKLMKMIYPTQEIKEKVLINLANFIDVAISLPSLNSGKIILHWDSDNKPRPGNNEGNGICQVNTYLEFQKQILKIKPDTAKNITQLDKIKLVANVQSDPDKVQLQSYLRNTIAEEYKYASDKQIDFISRKNYYNTESVIFEAGGFAETIKQIITNKQSQLLEHNPILIDLGYGTGFSNYGHSISLIINLTSIGNEKFYHISYYDSNEARNKVLRIPVKNLAQSDFLCPISPEYKKNQFVAEIYTKQIQEPDSIIYRKNIAIETIHPLSLLSYPIEEQADYLEMIKNSWKSIRDNNAKYFIELMQDLGLLIIHTEEPELINEYLSLLNEIPDKDLILNTHSDVYNCTLKEFFEQNGYPI